MKRLIPVLFLIAPAFAQMPGSFFPSQLKEYLGLSDAQVASIEKLNSDYETYNIQKQTRIAQVQRELVVETAKDNLDPMALGLRYVELETIRRELADQLTKSRTSAVALLNDAQKTKLKVLEDAMKLQPTISQAQCENLLDQSTTANLIPNSRVSPIMGNFSGGVIGVLLPSLACGPSFRSGDFSSVRPARP